MEKICADDISTLNLKMKLSIEEIFYYASYMHIVFVNIHPFNDGNGRAARQLGKWFLLLQHQAKQPGILQSEKYYYR